jgi:hypothetical protein
MQEEVVVKEEALEALQQALMHAVGRENARAGGAAEALSKLLVSAKVEISELNRRLKKAHDGERDLRRDRQLLFTQHQQQQQQASRAVTQEEQARAGSSSRPATTKKTPPGAAGASSSSGAASTLPPPLAVTFSPRSGGGVGKDARYGHDAWRERSRESSPHKTLGSSVHDLRVSGEYAESRLSRDSADWAAAGCPMLYITLLCMRILVDTDKY